MTDGPADASHTQHEDVPWTIQIPDHPPRADTPEYEAARSTMNRLAVSPAGEPYGAPPYQDHHGGGLWLKDDEGWFFVRNFAGIEWSAQFCADPAKVDGLRLVASRLYARFPEAVAELGIRDLLDTPITDAAGVARWTDSICNASLPLPPDRHVGLLPDAATGGVHHYPTPITDIDLIRRDDFQLWVETPDHAIAAVVPVAPRGSGDGRTRILLAAARPGAPGADPIAAVIGAGAPSAGGPTDAAIEGVLPAGPAPAGDRSILPADHPVSIAAFARQS